MSEEGSSLATHSWETPWGSLHALWSERGIACTHLGDRELEDRFRAWCRLHAADRTIRVAAPPADWSDQVARYLGGDRVAWTIPLDLRGTPFRQRVWEAIRTIPHGRVWTYAELATRIGQAGASRAIGGACGANPVPLIVPCHRVVSQSGLGGFSGPMEWKVGLLELEGVGLPIFEQGLEGSPDEAPERGIGGEGFGEGG